MERVITAVRKIVGQAPEVVQIRNNYETIHDFIGGYIEVLPLGSGITLICDEEGKLKGLPVNGVFRGDPIVGNILFVGDNGSEDFVSLTPKQIQMVLEVAQQWQWAWQHQKHID